MNRNDYGAKWAPSWCWEQAAREFPRAFVGSEVDRFIALEKRAVEIYAIHDNDRMERIMGRHTP